MMSLKMINKIVLLVFFIIGGLSGVVFSDNPSRSAYEDSNFSIFRTTGITGIAVPETSNISISSGVIKIFGIYVSSPGVNSELRLYDNRLTGTATNQIGIAIKTDSRDFIPLPVETVRGLIITSTATAGATWSQPSFNIYYIRRR